MKDPTNVKELLKDGKTKLDSEKKEELLDTVNELLNSKNKLEIHLPKAFYNELKMKAKNNDMELDDYATFLITKNYYKEEEKERKLEKYEATTKRQFLRKLQEQKAKNN